MKTLLLLFTGLLLTTAPVIATETHSENFDKNDRYRYAQPIMFVERGVEFLIFPDGSFDFNTNAHQTSYSDVQYRGNSKRSSINVAYKSPNANIQYTSNNFGNRGISISRDRDGKVRRIGNVYLNYDRSGNITRAGSVFMNYGRGRNATLTQVGGLRVNYNHFGEIVNTRGQVNRFNANNYNMDYGHGNKNDGVYHNDDNFYYYKQNGKVKKQKKNKR